MFDLNEKQRRKSKKFHRIIALFHQIRGQTVTSINLFRGQAALISKNFVNILWIPQQGAAYVPGQAYLTLHPRSRWILKNFNNKVCWYIPKLQKI